MGLDPIGGAGVLIGLLTPLPALLWAVSPVSAQTPPHALSDFNDSGLETVVLALITAGDDTQNGGIALCNDAANSRLRPPKCSGNSGRSSPGPGWSGGWSHRTGKSFVADTPPESRCPRRPLLKP